MQCLFFFFFWEMGSWFLILPGMVCVDLSWLLPNLGGSTCLWSVFTCRAGCVTPIDRVMKMVSREGSQFNVDRKPQWEPGILHSTKIVFFTEVKTSVCEQKSLCTHLTLDWTQNSLNESLVFYVKTTRSHFSINKVQVLKCYREGIISFFFCTKLNKGCWNLTSNLVIAC